MDECLMYRKVVAEKEGFVVWRANGLILVPPPPPSISSWTQHMHYYYHIFLTDLFVNSILRMSFLFCFVLAVLVLLYMWWPLTGSTLTRLISRF